MQNLCPITQYFWPSVLHMGQRQKIRLITQDLICSKRVEHVTEPVVNKSSQLLPLIITVITLIISNSAPWYEPRCTVVYECHVHPLYLIMSYAQESRAVGKEKVNFAERERTVLFYESLARVFGCLPFLWHCAPLYEPGYWRQMVNEEKKNKKTAWGDWYLWKVGYIRPCLRL